jgi:AcrR family transcriptional regulator
MARITKTPRERRRELVDTAERLFLTKGYDRTTVNDIVAEINVAKGTFYHYFQSKADILYAAVEKNVGVLEEEFRTIINRADLGTPEKLNEIINTVFRMYKGKEEVMIFIHQESNAVPHHRFEQLTYDRLVPPLVELVARGVGEGCFNVTYPTQTAEIMLAAISHQLHRPEFATSHSLRERMRITLEQFLARVLAVSDYSFSLEPWH